MPLQTCYCTINHRPTEEVAVIMYRNILIIVTGRSEQAVQTLIRLLLWEQSDQSLNRLQLDLNLSDAYDCIVNPSGSIFRTITIVTLCVPIFRMFTVLLLSRISRQRQRSESYLMDTIILKTNNLVYLLS